MAFHHLYAEGAKQKKDEKNMPIIAKKNLKV